MPDSTSSAFRRLRLAQERAQRREGIIGGAGRRVGFVGGVGQQAGKNVVGADQGIDQPGGDGDLGVAHAVHHRLELVREGDEVVEAEGAAAALDRMDGAEDGVNLVHVDLAGGEAQQPGLGDGQQFGAFVEVGLLEAAEIVHGCTPPLS